MKTKTILQIKCFAFWFSLLLILLMASCGSRTAKKSDIREDKKNNVELAKETEKETKEATKNDISTKEKTQKETQKETEQKKKIFKPVNPKEPIIEEKSDGTKSKWYNTEITEETGSTKENIKEDYLKETLDKSIKEREEKFRQKLDSIAEASAKSSLSTSDVKRKESKSWLYIFSFLFILLLFLYLFRKKIPFVKKFFTDTI